MKLKFLAASLAMLGAVGSANALTLFSGVNLLEDDNREYLIKGTGNTNANTIEIGDSLRGVIEFGKIEQINAPFGSINPISPELTGIFQTYVKDIVDYDLDGQIDDIIWGASANFEAAYGAGAMVSLFLGGTNLDLNSCSSIANCELAATDGALWAVAGFGDVDDQWISINSNLNWGLVTTLAASTKVAAVNYALSVLTNNTGYTLDEQALDCIPTGGMFLCAGDGKTDIIGSGDVLGGRGLTNGYGARSDIDATLNAIPEPESIALMGIALAGLGFSARRRQK